MPVQFLSGGGGGAPSEIRDVFAEPVLSNSIGGNIEKIMVQYTIPANYLQVNNCLHLKVILKQLGTINTYSSMYLRFGTTGTVSDTIIFSHDGGGAANAGYLVPHPTVPVLAEELIKIESIGTSGSCFTIGILENEVAVGHAKTGFTPASKTINTTVPLFLSLSMTYSNTAQIIQPVATSLTVSF